MAPINYHQTESASIKKTNHSPAQGMPMSPAHVVFAGGGTGGHLFPGLAVAARLADEMPMVRISFAGSGKDFERRQVAAAGFDYVPIACAPLPRRLRDVPGFVLANLSGYRAAKRFLAGQQVAAVVGLGGYASVPMARAAVRRGVALLLLEQNAVPGRATRWLARSAAMVCTAFRQCDGYLPARCPVRLTGNPIRGGFLCTPHAPREADRTLHALREADRTLHALREAEPHAEREEYDARANLLVLGGSAGARPLNEHVPQALARIRPMLAGWTIVHQSGPADVGRTQELYDACGLPAIVAAFLSDMPQTLAHTRLAICRAGGTTLAELAASGVPAVLVPYPHAADDHQGQNAASFAASGGCLVIDQRDGRLPLADRLAEVLGPLVADPSRLETMSFSIRRLAKPAAAAVIAAVIRQAVASGKW
jgi:UDP-N-acetylglucosamine--N-acetylmuramyl-(pentapeptide) pyrophosphoryl-undecaprenol N-acetylglucosamine transferase